MVYENPTREKERETIRKENLLMTMYSEVSNQHKKLQVNSVKKTYIDKKDTCQVNKILFLEISIFNASALEDIIWIRI